MVFYLIYAKFLETTSAPYDLQLKIMTVCELYSRDMGLVICALFCCFKLQKIFCLRKYYETSRSYCTKCLKMAVYMKDRDAEFEAVESIKLLNYYMGISAEVD